MRERKEDMNKDKMHERWKINEKKKLKQNIKHLKNKMLQSIKKTRYAKDEEIRYRPRHDKDTRTCYMC